MDTKVLVVEEEFKRIIGDGESIRDVLDNVRIVGASDIAVLILGESGTGKER